jgi:hypothetical protein
VSNLSEYTCAKDENGYSVSFRFRYGDHIEHGNSHSSHFNAASFLAMMAGKSLSVIGDSIGLQLFQAIDVDLNTYVDSDVSFDGNGTQGTFQLHNGKPLPQYERHAIAATRRYTHPVNSTTVIRFCRYSQFETSAGLFQIDVADFCLRKTLLNEDHLQPQFSKTSSKIPIVAEGHYTHYIVIGLGAWYKPTTYSGDGPYDLKLVRNTQFLMKDLTELRYALEQTVLSRRQTPTRVIWKLNTHMGPIDEIATAGYAPESFPHHQNWQGWGDPAVEAKWVVAYNDVIRAVAQAYGDLILVSCSLYAVYYVL